MGLISSYVASMSLPFLEHTSSWPALDVQHRKMIFQAESCKIFVVFSHKPNQSTIVPAVTRVSRVTSKERMNDN